jgi:SAM-dependent methyltransferase
MSTNPKADYGIDAPGVVRNLILLGLLGIALVVTGLTIRDYLGLTIFITGVITAIIGFGEAGWMIYGSRIGKYRVREKVLDLVELKPSDEVLDVGCGRGLVLNGAARRLTTGLATGLDLWQKQDQSGNDPEVTLANAKTEDVADRVKVQDGDMRQMPFPDASFDAVVSSLAIHNVPDAAGRVLAIHEIDRVLKPGGRAALLDFIHVRRHAEVLKNAGWQDVNVSGLQFSVFPPARIVTGTKPSSL